MSKREIEITCVVDETVGLKLPVVPLANLLNKRIQLRQYGIGIKKVLFVFIAVPLSNTIHEDHIVYTESDAHLEIALRLDYEKVISTSKSECMALLKDLFLIGLNLCHESNIGEFDWLKFDKSIRAVFRDNN